MHLCYLCHCYLCYLCYFHSCHSCQPLLSFTTHSPLLIEASQLVSVILEGLSELYEADFGVAALDGLSALFVSLKGRQQEIPREALHSLYQLLPKLLELVLENLSDLSSGSRHADDEEDDEDGSGSGFVDAADEEEVLYAWGRLQASLFEVFPQLGNEHAWVIAFVHERMTAQSSSGKQRRKASSASASSACNEAFGHAATGVLCDWMVWCGGGEGAGAVQYGQQLIDVISVGLASSSPLIKQAAVHLCGLLAKHGGPAFRDFCLQVAGAVLARIVARPDCQAPSQVAITDNAVSALIRIHRAFGLAADDAALVGTTLLPGLPVMNDDAEILPVLEFLAGAWNPQAPWAGELRSRLQKMERLAVSDEKIRSLLSKFN